MRLVSADDVAAGWWKRHRPAGLSAWPWLSESSHVNMVDHAPRGNPYFVNPVVIEGRHAARRLVSISPAVAFALSRRGCPFRLAS